MWTRNCIELRGVYPDTNKKGIQGNFVKGKELSLLYYFIDILYAHKYMYYLVLARAFTSQYYYLMINKRFV